MLSSSSNKPPAGRARACGSAAPGAPAAALADPPRRRARPRRGCQLGARPRSPRPRGAQAGRAPPTGCAQPRRPQQTSHAAPGAPRCPLAVPLRPRPWGFAHLLCMVSSSLEAHESCNRPLSPSSSSPSSSTQHGGLDTPG